MSGSKAARRAAAGVALAALLALGAPAAASATTGDASATDVVDVPVRFAVENVNRSRVPCPTDGGSYEIAGRLVGPASVLEGGAEAVTLYLHGLGFGQFFWSFRALPGYDYATEQARAGHVSVAIDRLGYDDSSRPAGSQICLGSHADIAHQVVTALREGDYRAGGDAGGPAFRRVALAGHSLGTQIAQIAAYSFGGIDALVTSAYSSEGATPLATRESFRSGAACAASDGEAADDGEQGPGGYAYFGQRPQDFRAAMFHDADPAAIEATTTLRNRDPCGDFSSILPAIVLNRVGLRETTVPVLIVCASHDALFDADRCMRQDELYPSSPDVSAVLLEGTGHALTVERTHDEFRSTVSSWLAERGF